MEDVNIRMLISRLKDYNATNPVGKQSTSVASEDTNQDKMGQLSHCLRKKIVTVVLLFSQPKKWS